MDKNTNMNSNSGLSEESRGLAGNIGHLGEIVKERLGGVAGAVGTQFTEGRGVVERTIRRYPLVAMASALVAGAAILGAFRYAYSTKTKSKR